MRALFKYLCAAAVFLTPAIGHAGKTYGLVIGVDNYQFITDLHGAENDARDIADALTRMDAEVTLLLNRDATRDAVLSAWRKLAQGLGPEDQLIVSYAGHGSHEPEFHKGSEADGRDETLLLSGFSPYGAASGERIRDDEIAELIALSPKGQVILVVDACHSGTVSRNLAPSLGFRYVSHGKITADPLPPPPPPKSHEAEREDAALFLAAGDDSEKIPEFLINGKPRGALSYSFAASLRDAAADENGDQVLTKGEIEAYVRRKVRTVSQGVQRPQVSPSGGNETVLFALRSGAQTPSPDAIPMAERDFQDLPKLKLHLPKPSIGPIEGVQLVAAQQDADLRFEPNTGKLISMVGDIIRQVPSRNDPKAAIQEVVDKLRLAQAMDHLSTELDVQFANGDRLYGAGDEVTVQVSNRASAHLGLLNVASDGQISFLYPMPSFGDPASIDPRNPINLPLQVQAPFGSDHVIAIDAKGHDQQLWDTLAAFDGTQDIRGLWDLLRSISASSQVAIFPFHTTDEQNG